MNKVVITGADGFIGSHLCKKFLEMNTKVTAIVAKNSSTINRINKLKEIQIIECDFNELEQCYKLFDGSVDAFYHLAWSGVSPIERNNLDIQLENINFTLNAVKLAAKISAKKIIIPGSTSEYGFCDMIGEYNVPTPQNLYGATKVATQFLSKQLAENLNVDYNYVICSSVYSENRRDNNVIHYVIDKLLNNEKPSLTRLEQIWDYIHIDDLIEGLIAVGKSGKKNKIYPLGAGDNCPLKDYIFKIRDIIDTNLELGIGEVEYNSHNKVTSSCLDTDILYKDTGFKAKIKFEDGISKMIEILKNESK